MKRSAQPLVAAAVLAVGVAGVFAILAMRPTPEERPQVKRAPLVEVMSVEPGPYEFVVRAHGTVVPRREGDLVPQVSGSVQWVSPALASGGFFWHFLVGQYQDSTISASGNLPLAFAIEPCLDCELSASGGFPLAFLL